MQNEQLYRLIARKLSKETTLSELQELHEYLKNSPSDQYAIEIIASYWDSKQSSGDISDDQTNEHFKHILAMADAKLPDVQLEVDGPIFNQAKITADTKIFWLKSIAIAASLLILIGLSWWMINLTKRSPDQSLVQQSEAIAQKGNRSKLTLPDGSVVLLNSDTKLKYPLEFSDSIREVYLDGEAYFDIKKEPGRPFIVHTSGMQIKVLGTTFNVKAYPADKVIETSLIHGSIEVTVMDRPNEKIILSPNEKLIIKNNKLSDLADPEKINPIKPAIAINQLIPDPRDSSISETQWVENRLVFRNESLAEVATRMERWYNVTIKIRDEELKATLLSGTFTNETIEMALDALAYTKSFRYVKNGDLVKIFK